MMIIIRIMMNINNNDDKNNNNDDDDNNNNNNDNNCEINRSYHRNPIQCNIYVHGSRLLCTTVYCMKLQFNKEILWLTCAPLLSCKCTLLLPLSGLILCS